MRREELSQTHQHPCVPNLLSPFALFIMALYLYLKACLQDQCSLMNESSLFRNMFLDLVMRILENIIKSLLMLWACVMQMTYKLCCRRPIFGGAGIILATYPKILFHDFWVSFQYIIPNMLLLKHSLSCCRHYSLKNLQWSNNGWQAR